jgi:hypothetical protein
MRKRERRQRQGAAAHDDLLELVLARALDEPEPAWWDDGPGFSLMRGGSQALTCGTCREFVEDGDGGRGTCLHPGSGILSPWTDTPGCPFHSLARR